jgi:predicted dinucleotide-binding enzyme
VRIAIIGAGNVGRALGNVWHRAGHEIVWNLRDPDDPKYEDLPGEKIKAIGKGLRKSDVTLLAVPWSAVDAVTDELGDFGGVLIDCTNPVASDLSGLDFKGAASGAAYLKSRLPRARVVKSFNQTGASNMADADYSGGRIVNFVCSQDESAASLVRELSEDVGFDTILVRGIEHARALEEMAWLWISLAIKQGHGPDFAYSILRR